MKALYSLALVFSGVAALTLTPFQISQAQTTTDGSTYFAQALTAEDWFRQATEKYQRGDFRGAIADFDRVIAINPDYADAYSNRGAAHAGSKDYPKAIADYDKAIALNPDLAEA